MPGGKKAVSIARAKNHAPAIRPPTNLWEALDAQIGALTPPEDCVSVQQFAKRYNVNHRKASRIVARLVREGVLTLVGIYGPQGSKYYRLVP